MNKLLYWKKYILFVYYNNFIGPVDSGIQRMCDFEYLTRNNLQLLPPSKIGFIEHIKRASYDAGWVAYRCVQNVKLPNPQQCGWNMINGQFEPRWQVIHNPLDALVVTAVSSCVKQNYCNCQCSRQKFECITYCKCRRHCQYNQN